MGSHADQDSSSEPVPAEQWMGALAAVLAIWSAYALRNGLVLVAEDRWLRIPLAVTVVGIPGALAAHLPNPAKWAVKTLAVVCAAMLVFPTGEAWDFLQETKIQWIAAMAAGCLIAWSLLNQRNAPRAGILALGWIASLVAAAFLTAQSFMRVTEPMLAIASVFGIMGFAAIWQHRSQLLLGAAGPSLFAMAAGLASAQFNSYLGMSDRLTWLAMLAPATAALLSHPFRERSGTDASATPATARGKYQSVITIILCLILAAAVIGWTQVAAGVGEEEW